MANHSNTLVFYQTGAETMSYGANCDLLAAPVFRHYVPARPLSDYIELFWYWNHKPSKAKERVLPGGTVEFVIRLTKDRTSVFQSEDQHSVKTYSGSVITGPQSKFFVLDKTEQDELLGIHFKPGGAFPFFGTPVNMLLNHHVSLDSIWGNEADSLRAELLESSSVTEKFQILERCLLKRLTHSFSTHQAVSYALKELGKGLLAKPISSIAEDVNLSTKRLTELFGREIGVTPKLFARIQRFQEALRIIADQRSVNWLAVALESGYYDQAHFNHDFLEFSGISPTTYLQKKTEHIGHVPI
jgi:AraC-like DNA-binding protein